MLTIYHAPGSRSVRVVWLAEEMGLPFRAEPVSLRNPSPAFKAASPLGAVPVLVDGETTMIESIAMMLYLVGKHAPTPLAVTPEERDFPGYLQFLIFAEGAIGLEVNPIVRSRFFAPEEHKANWAAQVAESRLAAALAFLSEQIGERPYVAADRFTIADIAIAHAIGVGKMLLGERTPANLIAYQERHQGRPAYQRMAATPA